MKDPSIIYKKASFHQIWWWLEQKWTFITFYNPLKLKKYSVQWCLNYSWCCVRLDHRRRKVGMRACLFPPHPMYIASLPSCYLREEGLLLPPTPLGLRLNPKIGAYPLLDCSRAHSNKQTLFKSFTTPLLHLSCKKQGKVDFGNVNWTTILQFDPWMFDIWLFANEMALVICKWVFFPFWLFS